MLVHCTVCLLLLLAPLATSLPLFQRPQFGNGMILQRGNTTRVFGSNAKGRIRITVAVPGQVVDDVIRGYVDMCMYIYFYMCMYMYKCVYVCTCVMSAHL